MNARPDARKRILGLTLRVAYYDARSHGEVRRALAFNAALVTALREHAERHGVRAPWE